MLVNGSPTKEVKMQKGLRQDDPLAPFLFFIVAEGLGGLMRSAVAKGIFSGFNYGHSGSASYLQYADDTLLLGEVSFDNMWVVKEVLISFEMASGLKLNFHKSCLYGVNAGGDFISAASKFLCCKTDNLSFTYLGLPVGARRASTWQLVIDMQRKRLARWKSRRLSFGGRIMLLRSVLSSILLYFLSFFRVPKKVLKILIGIQRSFLWSGGDGTRGIAWVCWIKVCLPKVSGGLGINHLDFFNLSLLGRWRWRFLVDKEAC